MGGGGKSTNAWQEAKRPHSLVYRPVRPLSVGAGWAGLAKTVGAGVAARPRKLSATSITECATCPAGRPRGAPPIGRPLQVLSLVVRLRPLSLHHRITSLSRGAVAPARLVPVCFRLAAAPSVLAPGALGGPGLAPRSRIGFSSSLGPCRPAPPLYMPKAVSPPRCTTNQELPMEDLPRRRRRRGSGVFGVF